MTDITRNNGNGSHYDHIMTKFVVASHSKQLSYSLHYALLSAEVLDTLNIRNVFVSKKC